MKFGAFNHTNMFIEDDRISAVIKKITVVLFDVIVAASLIFLAVIAARAQTADSFNITASTDKSEYDYKELITITLEAENMTGDDLIINFDSGCQMSFEVYKHTNSASGYSLPVYNETLYPRTCSESPTTITIPDGKKAIWTRTMDFISSDYPTLMPGDYVVYGYITGKKSEGWSSQRTAFSKFSVSYSQGGVEGSYCDENTECASTLDCKYSGLFTETGGVCVKDPYPYDDNGFKELLCLSTGGDYDGECYCPEGYEWNENAGCSTSGNLAELCLSTGGYITGPDFTRCLCPENTGWNVTQGCSESETQGFNDINGHWAEDYIKDLKEKGVISGYEDGGFHPNDNINRAELTKMALAAASISPEEPQNDPEFLFDDLDEWQIEWVYAAWKNGIVQGYSETEFAPAKDITRAEALKVAMEAFEIEIPDTSDEWAFPDTVGHWAISYINQAYLDFIVSGREDGKFYPDSPVTRAEAAKILQLLSEL